MQTQNLGQTGLKISQIGLGLAALGRPGYINLGHASDLNAEYAVEKMEAHSHQVLDAAWAGGVRYFDAARSYGRAEAFLASWLKKHQLTPAEVTVGSKWGYTYTAAWQVTAEAHEIKDHSLAVYQRQRAETAAILGDFLAVYQVHSATLSSGVLENTAVLDALALARSQGLKIGLSLSGVGQSETLEKALGVERDGVILFDTVQATWNVLEPSAGAMLAEAHGAGLGIIVKEAVANGRLTAKNDDPNFSEKMDVLQHLSDTYGTTLDALAMAYVLAQPWVGVVLSGAATVAHIDSNLKAAALTLDESTLSQLEALSESPERYWQTRSELPWN
jgi:aryl-alcohol dehydrogenase-like predicted oxidoreductase